VLPPDLADQNIDIAKAPTGAKSYAIDVHVSLDRTNILRADRALLAGGS